MGKEMITAVFPLTNEHLWIVQSGLNLTYCTVTCLPLVLQTAKANLEKAQSELVGVSDEASRAEIQISIDANEAIVKALEWSTYSASGTNFKLQLFPKGGVVPVGG